MWELLIIEPMVNSLLFLYKLLFNNLTLTVAVFTVLIRVITFPLMWQQQRTSKKMQELQGSDEWKDIQQKYAKDREKLQAEQSKLWQKAGVNPFGGCLPLLIQFPIMIGLYQAITAAVAASPIQLLTLSTHVYPFFPNVASLIPLDNQFLWMNLGLPDPFYVMPILVAATSWVQSKVMTPPASSDPNATQMTQTMAITSTLMFGYISLTLASGLSIYFLVSNIISIVQAALTQKVNWRNILSLKAPTPETPKDTASAKNKAKRKKAKA